MIRRLTKQPVSLYAETVKTLCTPKNSGAETAGGSNKTWRRNNSGSLLPGYGKRKK